MGRLTSPKKTNKITIGGKKMACFIAPLSLGIITTALRKKIPAEYNINWLNIMLLGGVLMLAVEHVAHQEILLYPPFFTAGIHEILPEIVAVGVPMTIAIVAIWGVITAISLRATAKAKNILKQ